MSDTKATPTTILLVEDDEDIARVLSEVLEGSGYRVIRTGDGLAAEAAMQAEKPGLVVLDLMLPDVDGLVLCANLKAIHESPIIICSATTRKRDTVLGLKLGADDFITKPFDVYEFEARVQAVLRRTAQGKATAGETAAAADQLRVGQLAIDRARRRVTLGPEAIQLTPTEYRLLSALASRPDEVFSRTELAQQVWGYQDASSGRTIDMHVRRLRVKLSSAGVAAPAIASVRGFGYKLAATEESTPAVAIGA